MRIIRRLVHWWRFRAHTAELEEELSFHRDAIERELIARGRVPADARREARRAMGNELLMREASRAVWLWPWLEGVWQDAKGTLRGLRKSPAFTAGVMLTFALGVGANAAMFSIIDRLMFRPPPLMRDPDSVHRVYLYSLVDGVEAQRGGGRYARYSDLARFTTSFSAVAGHSLRRLAVGVGQDARELSVGVVSASFFEFFDAPPVAGRYFTAVEDAPPIGEAVAVLSYPMWQTRYGGRADAIGSTLQIGAAVYTIIGVAPSDFVGLWSLTPPVAYIPVATYAASVGRDANWPTDYGWAFGLGTLVRRKAGVTIVDANTDLTNALVRSYRTEGAPAGGQIVDRIARLRPRAVAGSVLLERGPERSNVAKVTMWLGGMTIIVLLIACANVASLLLARALGKRREIAVRLALGVGRVRLLSQLLAESMLLAVAGSALGIVVATWINQLLSTSFLPGAEVRPIATEPRTLLLVGIVAVTVGVFTGVLPALQTRRLALIEDLKSGARAGTDHRSHARAALLVLQAALALVLLVGAGLFVRSLNNVRDVRLGFDADSVLVVETEWRGVQLDSAGSVALRQRLLAASLAVPGIVHASFQFAVPFDGMSSWPIFVEGVDSVRKFGRFDQNAVSPDYFATMGTRLLRGRGIADSDVAGARRVMVVGASMAAVLWPGQDPLGKCVRVEDQRPFRLPEELPCTYVVGVAEDIHTQGLGPETRYFYYYVPAAQLRPHEGGLFVRVRGDPREFLEPLRGRLQQEMPGAAYVTVTRLAENIERETRSWVMGATVFTAFGALALVLAAVGLYSVTAYDVAQRKREMAVRMALGAAASDVIAMIVGQGLRYAASGAAAGAVIALVAGRWIAPLLFEQSARDPAVLGTVAGALLLIAVVASLVPAIGAVRMQPNAVLRSE
jgi:predicted permease